MHVKSLRQRLAVTGTTSEFNKNNVMSFHLELTQDWSSLNGFFGSLEPTVRHIPPLVRFFGVPLLNLPSAVITGCNTDKRYTGVIEWNTKSAHGYLLCSKYNNVLLKCQGTSTRFLLLIQAHSPSISPPLRMPASIMSVSRHPVVISNSIPRGSRMRHSLLEVE